MKTGLADFYVLSKDLPALEEELKESICESTNLKQLREIIRKYTTDLSEGPYALRDEMDHYFSKIYSPKDLFDRLQDGKYPAFAESI